MRTRILCAFVLFFIFSPHVCIAQGNNMNIYNNILRQHNHPSQQKRFRDSDIEAPLLDVDEIVRRENEARRRQQMQQQQRMQPMAQQQRPTSRCREGTLISNEGCGPMGIQACTCVNGQATWVPLTQQGYR